MIDNSSGHSRLSPDDRLLIQALGSRLRRIINDEEAESIDIDRRDELGILANMVNRVAKELRNSRRRDTRRREELEQRLEELRAAHATQERLLATIRELSTPVLSIYDGVLLLPLIGSIDSARANDIIATLLEQTAVRQARSVIMDVTGLSTIDTQVANVLLQAAQAAQLLGARVILCGLTPHVAQVIVSLGIDLNALTPCVDLQSAIQQAVRLVDRDRSRSVTY
jgi:rsbT co-antagonist protein RsbR